jgi:DGQHR domain-containing protein
MESATVFPAVRTVQGGHAFYIAAVPFAFIAAVWTRRSDQSVFAPASRSRATRVEKQVAEYLARPCHRLLAPMVAAVDGGLHFEPLRAEEGLRGSGRLSLEIGASILWIDGRARAAGIARAVRTHPNLGRESIGMVITAHLSERARQALSADLNRPGKKRGKSCVDCSRAEIDAGSDRHDLKSAETAPA